MSTRMALHWRVLIGFAIGIGGGIAAHLAGPDNTWIAGLIDYVAAPAGQLFLRLLFMLVLPLMFSALILGVSEIGDIAALGRIGWRTLLYTVTVTCIAIGVGLLVVNLLQPGRGMDPEMLQQAIASSGQAKSITEAKPSLSVIEMLLGIVPRNVVKAAGDGELLAVMFFALMCGVAIVLKPTPATQRFKEMIQGLNEIVMTLIGLVIRLTPYAVAALMFALTARFGWDLLLKLGHYAFAVLLAIALHMFVVLPIWVRVMGGMSPLRFFRDSQEAILTAFSTASSTGTLPTTLKVAEENLKLPPKVARFVLTIGASANHHGTALFEGLTTLFLVQCFGVELGLGQQVMVLGLCILGSIGTAGVPAGSLPVIAMILTYLHVPPEGIAIILGVDRFLDMCRTALNVTGDLATAVVVAKHADDAVLPFGHEHAARSES
ncbi:dicarboxylate/amino acid:cation symporter [Dokdonella sp.]|uniref:dicarboxylate/amino acid:cation symporter n=1 Tax=Dokdonella sp. TaxID=2291710 RepID=UPI00263944CB|nr:dicarboxylate/amino acid:cation symporter [Dokdonella sp.]